LEEFNTENGLKGPPLKQLRMPGVEDDDLVEMTDRPAPAV
jgi:hypothetical protein